MSRAVPLRVGIAAAAAVACSLAACSTAGSTQGIGSTAYERCPDELVDAWLDLGRDDGYGAADLERSANGPGDLPVGQVTVLCSVALTDPDRGAAFTLSVLASPGAVPEIVAAIAAEQGYVEEESPRPDTALRLVSSDGSTRYELSLPGDEVLTSSDFESAGTAFLLEGATSHD